MKHHLLKASALVLLMSLAGAILSACQYGGTPAATTNQAAQPAANSVEIKSMAFTPAALTVKVGQTVTWTNQDQFAHTVTSDAGEFKSGNLAKGGTYTFTFTKAGTYTYHCNIHTSMKAKVIVTE